MDGVLIDPTDDTTAAKCPKKADLVSSPTDVEIDNFYKKLSKCRNKAAILSIALIPKIFSLYKPTLPSFLQPLPKLFREE